MMQASSCPAGGLTFREADVSKFSRDKLGSFSENSINRVLVKRRELIRETRKENAYLRSEIERLRGELQFKRNDRNIYRSMSSMGFLSNLSADSLSSRESGSELSQLRYFMDVYQSKTVLGLRQIGISGKFAFDDQHKEREHILNSIQKHRFSVARQKKLLGIRPQGNKKLPLKQPDKISFSSSSGLGEAVVVEPCRASIYSLPRGGVYVKTRHGAVQFGIPPETIKDSLKMGLTVPTHYVVPRERFNLNVGINMCDIEFPGYFNFFLQNLSVNLVVMPEVEDLIRTVMNETLEGPDDSQLSANMEYPANGPLSGRFSFAARPNHRKEIDFFKEPRNGREITTSSMFNFLHFLPSDPVHKSSIRTPSPIGTGMRVEFMDESVEEKDTGGTLVADLGNGILIEDNGNEYILYDDYIEIAKVPHFLATWAPLRDPSYRTAVPAVIVDPPQFGVTVLGSSHGFDESGSTSGFVLWINKKGVMVDPPPNSTAILMEYGILPDMIDAVILTHCHADHDAGTFQKILKEGRITLFTTQTIFDSFVRKYSVISGFTEEFLLRLFEQRIVNIGESVHWGGGTLRFFYSLHALPCIGFEAHLGGKSFAYSADTFYEPGGLRTLRDRGFISQERYLGLLDFPFHYDLCIHEAGIPPIHTPIESLENLSPEIRQNLYIIHITEERAKQSSLPLAKAGVENTIVIPLKPGNHDEAVSVLRLLERTELFGSFTVQDAVDLLRLGTERRCAPGECVYKHGDTADVLYIVISGICKSVDWNMDCISENLKYSKDFLIRNEVYEAGDHFGYSSFINREKQTGCVVALTDVNLLLIDREAFQYFIRSVPTFAQRIEELTSLRKALSWKTLDKNSVFSRLASSQRSQLLAILKPCQVKIGKILWRRNKPVSRAYLVASGELEFVELRKQLSCPFQEGAFLCNLKSMLSQRNVVPLIEVMRDSVSVVADKGRESFDSFDGSFDSGDIQGIGISFRDSQLERLSARLRPKSVSSRRSYGKKKRAILTSTVTLVAKSNCMLYYIESEDLLTYLDHNPGIFINLIDTVVLE